MYVSEREREKERERNDALLYWLLPALAFPSTSVFNGTLTSFTMTLSESPHCFPSLLLLVPISFLFKMAASKLIDL